MTKQGRVFSLRGIRDEKMMSPSKGSRDMGDEHVGDFSIPWCGCDYGMIAIPSGSMPTEIVATTRRVVRFTTDTSSVSVFVT